MFVDYVDPCRDPEDIEDSADLNAGPDLGFLGQLYRCADLLGKSSKIWFFNVVASIYKLQMEFRILALLSDLSISDWVPLSLVNFDWMASEQELANVSFRFMLVISST